MSIFHQMGNYFPILAKNTHFEEKNGKISIFLILFEKI